MVDHPGPSRRATLPCSRLWPAPPCTLPAPTTRAEHTSGCPATYSRLKNTLSYFISQEIAIWHRMSGHILFHHDGPGSDSVFRMDIPQIPARARVQSECRSQNLSEYSYWFLNWLEYFHLWYPDEEHFCFLMFWQPRESENQMKLKMIFKFDDLSTNLLEKFLCCCLI